MCPSAPRVCSEPGGQKPVLSLSMDRIHRAPVNSPHKGQWRGALMSSLICVWINGWVNNREAGDLRRYRAHLDVTVKSRCTGCQENNLLHFMSSADSSATSIMVALLYVRHTKRLVHKRDPVSQSQNNIKHIDDISPVPLLVTPSSLG